MNNENEVQTGGGVVNRKYFKCIRWTPPLAHQNHRSVHTMWNCVYDESFLVFGHLLFINKKMVVRDLKKWCS